MKLDPKTAERMKRAAIERQAQKQAEASKRPSKREIVHDPKLGKKLKNAGRDTRSEQPDRILKALSEIPDAQTDRIIGVAYQDAPKGEKSAWAVMVKQVHDDVYRVGVARNGKPGNLRAVSGWLGYAELYERAQPSQIMQYGEKISGGFAAKRDEDRDPAWLEATGELRVFHKLLDKPTVTLAQEVMRFKERKFRLSDIEAAGMKIANAFDVEKL
jgi:hypothetical protein